MYMCTCSAYLYVCVIGVYMYTIICAWNSTGYATLYCMPTARGPLTFYTDLPTVIATIFLQHAVFWFDCMFCYEPAVARKHAWLT